MTSSEELDIDDVDPRQRKTDLQKITLGNATIWTSKLKRKVIETILIFKQSKITILYNKHIFHSTTTGARTGATLLKKILRFCSARHRSPSANANFREYDKQNPPCRLWKRAITTSWQILTRLKLFGYKLRMTPGYSDPMSSSRVQVLCWVFI